MALGISFVVFEPVVVQLYQQALDVDFSHALNALGINLPVLVYARAGVAVALGAILALTNGESSTEEEVTEETAVVKTMPVRRQRFVWLKRLWHWLRLIGQKQPEAGVPVAVNQEPQAQAAILQASDALLGEPAQAPAEQLVMTEEMAVEQVEVPDEIVEAPTAPLVAVEQSVVEQMEAPEQPADIVEQVADEAAQPIEGTAQSECPGMTRLSNGRRK
jgi:hypothetical protein